MPAIKKPNQHFDATLWTGTAVGSRAITNDGGFQPDFVWLKDRTSAYSHQTNDSVRGATNGCLYTDLTNAVDANYGITSFNSNGFTLGNTASLISSSFASQNGTGDNYVAWQWKAGGTAVTNTSGTISSQVSANPTAGFSIVTYTGNGTIGSTVGHGLGVAPSMIIVKKRNTATSSQWTVGFSDLGWNKYILLNSTGASATDSNVWNSTPTLSVFYLGNDTWNNGSTNTYVAYCWTPIAGYSAFGSYTGNGSTNGPFVYTGFRPRFIMIKDANNASGPWVMYDTSRSPYNAMVSTFRSNTSGVEDTYSASDGYNIDALSNGFKVYSTWNGINNSGDTTIYAAFAENPFKYANAR